jgi:hypothetical protein
LGTSTIAISTGSIRTPSIFLVIISGFETWSS